MKTYLISLLILVSLLGGIVLYGNATEDTRFVKSSGNSPTPKINVPEGAYLYRLSEGSKVEYVVLQKVFGKANKYITGTASTVSGDGWFNPNNGFGFVQVSLDMKDMKTDDAIRNEHVTQMFSDTNIRFSADLENTGITLDRPFEVEVPGQITLNSIAKNVIFNVTGQIQRDRLTAKGYSSIKMTDFGITPPSLVNVSSADDDVELKFDIEATRIN